MVNILYDNSPVSIQNLMVTLQGVILNSKRYGKIYYKELSYLKSIEKKDKYRIQLQELNEILKFSKENSSFYKEKLKDVNIPIREIRELKKISILTKEDIRNHIDDIITIPKKEAVVTHTGGTTGKSLTVYRTKSDMEKRMAYLDFFKEKHGVRKGMKRASFMGRAIIPINNKRDIYWRYNASLKQMLYSSFHLSDENMRFYIDSLNTFKPLSIDGFPSSISSIARYILKNNIKLDFTPICIFPTAETLLDKDKRDIEKAFGAPVRDQYASSEGSPFITECEKGNLHLNIETGVFEAAETDRKETGILVTSFYNYGTPLIRYKIGDSVVWSDKKCSCGDNSPLVERIVGRTADYLTAPDGFKITSVNMANAVKVLPNSIVESQFIQVSKSKIRINLVVDSANYMDEHKEVLINEMHQRLGTNMIFEIRLVNELEKDKSGKTRMIINRH